MYKYSRDKSDLVIQDLLLKITPLFSSFTAFLNSIANDLELLDHIILKHYQHNPKIQYSVILETLIGTQMRLECFKCVTIEEKAFVDELFEKLHHWTYAFKTNNIWKSEQVNLEIAKIKEFVLLETKIYLDEHDIDIQEYLNHHPLSDNEKFCARPL